MASDDRAIEASASYLRERERLLAALGKLTEGGVVESVAHIGATSVPGLQADTAVDIGMAIIPFPLDPERRSRLAKLGYEAEDAGETEPEQRFRHATGAFRLFLVEAGAERWTDYLLLRDYLRHDAVARQSVSERKAAWMGRSPSSLTEISQSVSGLKGPCRESAGPLEPAQEDTRSRLITETIASARRWHIEHRGFKPVERVVQELESLPVPWMISSGWALDLFLGRVTRVHHDVDVTVAREHQLIVQAHMTGLGWKWMTPLDGRLEVWPPHMRIEMPRHQAHAHRGDDFIDFPFSEIRNGVWRFRRDPSILRAVERISCRTDRGIPYLAPEIVLLFKSKNSGSGRAKDLEDFLRVMEFLPRESRAWLRWALTVTDSEHPWIALLPSP